MFKPFNLLYLAFRLAPFIIVSSFVLQSILNWDVRGIIYLLGLMIACGCTLLINRFHKSNGVTLNPKCGIISLGEETGATISNYPLSMTTYGFTFFYLFYFILNMAKRGTTDGLGNLQQGDVLTAIKYNLPTMIVFPLLIALEFIWILMNACSQNWLYIFASLCVGGIIGLLWGYIVVSIDPNLQIVTSSSGVQVCSRPSKTYYQCRVANKSTTTK
jgi:hypothetical protein